MQILVSKKLIFDNGYFKGSEYYRTCVALPEKSKFAGYHLEIDIEYSDKGVAYICPQKTNKIIKTEREVGKRYKRPILTDEELAKEFGTFVGELWLGRYKEYAFRGKQKEWSGDFIEVGYYDGKAWFTGLNGKRHRVSADTFELVKKVDEVFIGELNSLRNEKTKAMEYFSVNLYNKKSSITSFLAKMIELKSSETFIKAIQEEQKNVETELLESENKIKQLDIKLQALYKN